MIQEVAPGIFCIQVTLPNNPLKATNSYYIPGPERDLVIDTGFAQDICREVLFGALKELGSREDRRDVFLTHRHSDHSGLCTEVCGENGRVYMGETELYHYRRRAKVWDDKRRVQYPGFKENGFPAVLLEELTRANAASKPFNQPAPDDRFIPIPEGGFLKAGQYRLQVIEVPGHSPGHAMLWEASRGIMFTGDHILFDISPNITTWGEMKDSLGSYLESLKKVKDYPVQLALPGHRKSGEYRTRVWELEAHHKVRLEEIRQILTREPGLTTYEIAGKMSWRIHAHDWEEFPVRQKIFAFSECQAHLDHLQATGELFTKKSKGMFRYYRKEKAEE